MAVDSAVWIINTTEYFPSWLKNPKIRINDANNPMHEAYACLLANGLEGSG